MRIEICGASKLFFSFAVKENKLTNYIIFIMIDVSIARVSWHTKIKMLFYYNSFLSSPVPR
jgi:hypothetical protein